MTIAATVEVRAEVDPASMRVSADRGGVELIDGLAEEWRDLCPRSADDQIFYRPEFLGAHIRNMLPRAKVLLITVRRAGRLCLVLPLVEEGGTFSKIPVRKLRVPADFNCGRFDAVCSSGAEGAAAIGAAWRFLRKMPGWDLLQLLYSPTGSATARLAEGARGEGFPTIQTRAGNNPYILVPSPNEVVTQMPRNARLRTKLRQVRRRIAEKGSLKFYSVATADRNVLDRLFALEASGWKARNGTAVNCHPQARQFFDDLAEFAARHSYLRLYMLEFGNELMAAHFSLIYKGRCHSPVVTYNEKFKEFAPGHLIVSEILQDCAASGLVCYDITGHDQEWKMKWTNQALPVNHELVFRGPIGRLAYGMEVRIKAALGLTAGPSSRT